MTDRFHTIMQTLYVMYIFFTNIINKLENMQVIYFNYANPQHVKHFFTYYVLLVNECKFIMKKYFNTMLINCFN